MNTPSMEGPAVVGRCECGGYGVLYNEEWKARLGRCHDTPEELRERQAAVQAIAATPRAYCTCGHRATRHDPEDGNCEAHAETGLGACPCRRFDPRDLAHPSPSEPQLTDARAAYMNARTCVCGNDASAHKIAGRVLECEGSGFDPDWEWLREKFEQLARLSGPSEPPKGDGS